jgi:hypothetical protein
MLPRLGYHLNLVFNTISRALQAKMRLRCLPLSSSVRRRPAFARRQLPTVASSPLAMSSLNARIRLRGAVGTALVAPTSRMSLVMPVVRGGNNNDDNDDDGVRTTANVYTLTLAAWLQAGEDG